MTDRAPAGAAKPTISILPAISLVQIAFWKSEEGGAPGMVPPVGTVQLDGSMAFAHAPGRLLLYSPTAERWTDPVQLVDKRDACVVDLSHSRVAYSVTGVSASNALQTLFAIDLSALTFPIGHGCATVYHDAPVFIVRMAPDEFHCLVARSFTCDFAHVIRALARHDPHGHYSDRTVRNPSRGRNGR